MKANREVRTKRVLIYVLFGGLLLALTLVVVTQKIFALREIDGVRRLGHELAWAFFGDTKEIDLAYSPEEVWAAYRRATNTTAFFTSPIRESVVKCDYSLFSAPGVTPYRGTNTALFKPENNAWCMVGDLTNESSNQVPVFLTRNVKACTLAELHGLIADTLSDEAPFGKKCVIVVLKNHKAFTLDGNADWSSVLGAHDYTNRILRP